METMTLLANSGTAVLVVTLTLCIQCAGIEVLTRLARASIERGVARRSALHAAHPVFPLGAFVLFFGHQLFNGRLW